MPKADVKCPVCLGTHRFDLTDEQQQGLQPFSSLCPDLDRRYRLTGFHVDSRRNLFADAFATRYAADEFEHLRTRLGTGEFDAKARWKSIAYPPIGIIDEYPKKISEIIDTYSIGCAYPAVTSSCCLAERILNRLVLRCRGHFPMHPEYKKIYQKDSFDDWEYMLRLVADWNLIPEKAIELLRELMPIRHQTIHYNDGYDFEAIAESTLNKLVAAIGEIFGVMNRKDLYLLFDVPGEVWVRSEAESLPFVKEFVLPYCYRAHAVHDIDQEHSRIVERLGKVGPLTDDEFVELRKNPDGLASSPFLK